MSHPLSQPATQLLLFILPAVYTRSAASAAAERPMRSRSIRQPADELKPLAARRGEAETWLNRTHLYTFVSQSYAAITTYSELWWLRSIRCGTYHVDILPSPFFKKHTFVSQKGMFSQASSELWWHRKWIEKSKDESFGVERLMSTSYLILF